MTTAESLRWPRPAERKMARAAFYAALRRFETASGDADLVVDDSSQPQSESLCTAASSSTALIGVDAIEPLDLWREVVQRGAPSYVRSNVWLTLGWAGRAIRCEDPKLFWFALSAALLLSSGWLYGGVRAVVERLAV